MPRPDFNLYLVTDRKLTGGRELVDVVAQALAGGVKAVQLREKDLGGGELFQLAKRLKDVCARHRARLFINDRVDVALAVDADGVQLGGASMPVGAARSLLGEAKFIGASIHTLEEARDAERAGADFLLFGPVYFTPSKAAYGAPQGLKRLKEVVEKISIPVYAIGGISADNVETIGETGARGVALISAIIAAPDPAAAAQAVLQRLKTKPSE
ncbi:MAG TPA: thiamine phosphate synthase [Candidatus Binatia bacterium]